jgi:hypothetical protein
VVGPSLISTSLRVSQLRLRVVHGGPGEYLVYCSETGRLVMSDGDGGPITKQCFERVLLLDPPEMRDPAPQPPTPGEESDSPTHIVVRAPEGDSGNRKGWRWWDTRSDYHAGNLAQSFEFDAREDRGEAEVVRLGHLESMRRASTAPAS